MSSIITTHKVVKEILENHKNTRGNDDILYLRVAEKYAGKDISNMSFSSVMLYRNLYGVPCFETVRRVRQKLQADHPELRPAEGTRRKRSDAEEEYRSYAKGVQE